MIIASSYNIISLYIIRSEKKNVSNNTFDILKKFNFSEYKNSTEYEDEKYTYVTRFLVNKEMTNNKLNGIINEFEDQSLNIKFNFGNFESLDLFFYENDTINTNLKNILQSFNFMIKNYGKCNFIYRSKSRYILNIKKDTVLKLLDVNGHISFALNNSLKNEPIFLKLQVLVKLCHRHDHRFHIPIDEYMFVDKRCFININEDEIDKIKIYDEVNKILLQQQKINKISPRKEKLSMNLKEYDNETIYKFDTTINNKIKYDTDVNEHPELESFKIFPEIKNKKNTCWFTQDMTSKIMSKNVDLIKKADESIIEIKHKINTQIVFIAPNKVCIIDDFTKINNYLGHGSKCIMYDKSYPKDEMFDEKIDEKIENNVFLINIEKLNIKLINPNLDKFNENNSIIYSADKIIII